MHTTAHSDRVALGRQIYIAAIFAPLVLSGTATLVGLGLRFSWFVLIAGCLLPVLMLILGEFVYRGSQFAALLVLGWGVIASLAAAVFAIALVNPAMARMIPRPAALAIFLQFLAQVVFAALVVIPLSVRVFLASQRGEILEVTADEPVAETYFDATPRAAAPSFLPTAEQSIRKLARILKLFTFATFATAALVFGLAIYLIATQGSGWTLILVGLFALVSAMIMLCFSEDFGYLSSIKGYESAHLGNARESARVLFNVQAGVATLTGFVALFAWIVA